MPSYYKTFTAKAPINIALIKYWGKKDEKLKIPINDSISATLSIQDMCATTSVAISDTYTENELWLNGKKQRFDQESHAKVLLDEIKGLSKLEAEVLSYKIHIVSENNFPTAAGLASSAAGYACLAFVLGNAYGVTDPTELSRIARRGSGSACRSLFGGFVHWKKGHDHQSSVACQIVEDKHWSDLRVVICVINDQQKDVSSSEGMARSVNTSSLIQFRAESIVPSRIEEIKRAIHDKDFQDLASITMRDSNQFHAICLDTLPPLFYLNEASKQIIKICSLINDFYGSNKVAYTFDAGPNACVFVRDDFVDHFIHIIQDYFPATQSSDSRVQVRGAEFRRGSAEPEPKLLTELEANGVTGMTDSLRHIIKTSVGVGPKMVSERLSHEALEP